METFKKSKLGYILFACLLLSCKERSTTKNIRQDETLVIIDTFHINEDLKKISIDFIKTNKISNSIIEVDIDKREYNQIYISLTCKGVSYFIVKKLAPLFTYELNNNTFFVFTGAEELLRMPFDEMRYKNRRQERCDTITKSCYIFKDNKIQKEENCSLPEPFSSMPPLSLPPPLNKNIQKFNPAKAK